eukprot:4597821-Alexandrium_andersonii.AAC.1
MEGRERARRERRRERSRHGGVERLFWNGATLARARKRTVSRATLAWKTCGRLRSAAGSGSAVP